MISRILFAIQHAFKYIKEHPQMLFVLVLIFVIPMLFLYSGQQFLEVGRQNQDKLQKDRIGLMQDAFVSVLEASNFSSYVVQKQIEKIAKINQDITAFRIVKLENGTYTYIAALDTTLVATRVEKKDDYQRSVLSIDNSMIFIPNTDGEKQWDAYRSIPTNSSASYFIYTSFAMGQVDSLFLRKEHEAYIQLAFIYIVFIALAYWFIKLTDYKYLYLEVRKANDMKDLFTNMIAHELRAPLTAIRGYSTMIDESTENPELKKYAVRISDSSERLLAIVNDLLDVARIQSGKLSVEKEVFDASEVVIAVVDELYISAQEKNIALSHSGAIDTHLIEGDRKRLHQALTNLVSNSIKYTKDGAIELTIEEKITTVEIRVKDTGMGIASDDQKQLFAPFFRVQNDDVSQITGTGLGMWITKQLIELMEAKIGVESIEGVGTHVVVKLNKRVKDHGKWGS